MAPRRRRIFDPSTIIITALVVVAAATVLVRQGADRFLHILGGDLALFVAILPNVLAGCLIGSFMTMMLPREVMVRWVGAESGLPGLIIATLAGLLLPGGPFTVYPVAAAMLVAGADIGAAVTFITAWTLMGYSRALVWELPFFGLDFILWRIIVSAPFPIMVGLLARYALRLYRARKGSA